MYPKELQWRLVGIQLNDKLLIVLYYVVFHTAQHVLLVVLNLSLHTVSHILWPPHQLVCHLSGILIHTLQ